MRHLTKSISSIKFLAASAAALLLGLALGRVHVRAQTTLIGYKIGHLKGEEAKLLEERSTLRMQLAKMTTQKHLTLMTDTTSPHVAGEGTYALK
jgi:hypothetical protein